MKIYDQVLWERNAYTKHGLTPCACQQRYPMSNFSMSDPLPFVRSFVQCPMSNVQSFVQCQCPATTAKSPPRTGVESPPVGQTLGPAILMKRPCPWGGTLLQNCRLGGILVPCFFVVGGRRGRKRFYSLLLFQCMSASSAARYAHRSSPARNLPMF